MLSCRFYCIFCHSYWFYIINPTWNSWRILQVLYMLEWRILLFYFIGQEKREYWCYGYVHCSHFGNGYTCTRTPKCCQTDWSKVAFLVHKIFNLNQILKLNSFGMVRMVLWMSSLESATRALILKLGLRLRHEFLNTALYIHLKIATRMKTLINIKRNDECYITERESWFCNIGEEGNGMGRAISCFWETG